MFENLQSSCWHMENWCGNSQKNLKTTTMVECVSFNAANTLKKMWWTKKVQILSFTMTSLLKKKEKKRQLSMIASERVGI